MGDGYSDAHWYTRILAYDQMDERGRPVLLARVKRSGMRACQRPRPWQHRRRSQSAEYDHRRRTGSGVESGEPRMNKLASSARAQGGSVTVGEDATLSFDAA